MLQPYELRLLFWALPPTSPGSSEILREGEQLALPVLLVLPAFLVFPLLLVLPLFPVLRVLPVLPFLPVLPVLSVLPVLPVFPCSWREPQCGSLLPL